MTDTHATKAPGTSATDGTPGNRGMRLLTALASDVGVALLWAALITAIVLFSGVVSQFAYVDF